jgi:DNA-binding LytR/AlgR family response regulator
MKVLIIEDESLIARELQFKIGQIAPDLKILGVVPSVKTANKWFLENAEPDLIFADIQLSDGVSFEIFERYELQCPIVFTTAYDEYAIRAFKVNGVDYLLKPVDNEELTRAINKCRTIVESRSQYPKDMQQLLKMIATPQAIPTEYKEKFVVSYRHQWLPVFTKDIACFSRDGVNYLHTFTGERYVLDFTTLDEVEELLDPRLFFRANRQYIIHADAIQSVKPLENQKLVLTMKAPAKLEIDISREKAPGFKRWFER